MSLIADAKRAQAGTELESHKSAIIHHVEQIKLSKAKIERIKSEFIDDVAEIDDVLNEVNKTIGSI